MDISRDFVVSNTQISIRVFMRTPRYLQQQILNAEIGDIWHIAFMAAKSMMSVAMKSIIHGRPKERMSTVEQTAFCVSRI